jgi:endonuclease/exonuclease/phosphatase (EEP) superfamily protein YafD
MEENDPMSTMLASPGRFRRLPRRGWPTLVVIAAAIHPSAFLLARWDWRADLITHFQEPALAVTLAGVAVLIWKHRALAVALALLAVLQTVPLLQYAGENPVQPDPRSPARLRIVMANVLVWNRDFDALARLIERERPDVVGLVEVDADWIKGLAQLHPQYPYRLDVPFGAMGLALWFRDRPVLMEPPRVLVKGGWPVLHAVIDFGGQTRHLWLAHPCSPLRRLGRPPGQAELMALAEEVRRSGGSRIVIGDLNCTDGSPFFHDFLQKSGLRDSRLGFGRQPSWPAGKPYRLALDHALVSEDLAVVDRRLGPEFGSDHLPLILELAPAAAAVNTAKSLSTQSWLGVGGWRPGSGS